jgi:hypothetical protein
VVVVRGVSGRSEWTWWAAGIIDSGGVYAYLLDSAAVRSWKGERETCRPQYTSTPDPSRRLSPQSVVHTRRQSCRWHVYGGQRRPLLAAPSPSEAAFQVLLLPNSSSTYNTLSAPLPELLLFTHLKLESCWHSSSSRQDDVPKHAAPVRPHRRGRLPTRCCKLPTTDHPSSKLRKLVENTSRAPAGLVKARDGL